MVHSAEGGGAGEREDGAVRREEGPPPGTLLPFAGGDMWFLGPLSEPRSRSDATPMLWQKARSYDGDASK